MINESRVEAAVEFIRDNAPRLGDLVGLCKKLEHERKVVRAQQILESEKGTVSDREADAESSPEYKSIIEDYGNAWAEKTVLETQMKAAELTIDVWRSQNKTRSNV